METVNFGSFPRSGNHFFVNLSDKLFVNTKLVWNEHKSFSSSNRKNAVTTIRNPADAVFSLCANTGEINKRMIDSSLIWYKLYYENIIKIKALVIDFEELISNPISCFNYIVETYNLNEASFTEESIMNIKGKETNRNSDKLRQDIFESPMFFDADKIFKKITQRNKTA